MKFECAVSVLTIYISVSACYSFINRHSLDEENFDHFLLFYFSAVILFSSDLSRFCQFSANFLPFLVLQKATVRFSSNLRSPCPFSTHFYGIKKAILLFFVLP